MVKFFISGTNVEIEKCRNRESSIAMAFSNLKERLWATLILLVNMYKDKSYTRTYHQKMQSFY